MTYAEFLTVLSQFSGRLLPPVTGGAWYDTTRCGPSPHP